MFVVPHSVMRLPRRLITLGKLFRAVCNQIKEHAGWQHQATPEQLTMITPIGHKYSKTSGPALQGLPPDKREPPDEEPLPEVRPSTDCYTKNSQWAASVRIAA